MRAIPKVGVDDVFGRKPMEAPKRETLRIPEDLDHVLHEVYKPWTTESHDGILTRSQLLTTLCGPKKGTKQPRA
jgi:hypothetical protein